MILAAALTHDSARGLAGTSTMCTLLVIAETALTVILLAAAGLLAKGFVRLVRVDPLLRIL